MGATALPDFLRPWLERPIVCACGAPHAPGLKRVLLGRGVLDQAAEILAAAGEGAGGGDAGPILLLADPDTHAAAGVRVENVLRSGGRPVVRVLASARPHADDAELDRLRPALRQAPRRIVAVGSGTISDLGKALAAEAGVPLMTVGTAASMNGYASSIVALTAGGLKITRAAAGPDILILDLDVLAAAPDRMAAAGFGDLSSKPVSGGDWILSHRLLGDRLCPAALSMTDAAAAQARAAAAGIGAGEASAIAALAEALVLSGLSMTIAGASSPASGGEHLLSHYLDISIGHGAWARAPRLHGEQVAVGTLASLALYRRIRAAGPGAAKEAASKILAGVGCAERMGGRRGLGDSPPKNGVRPRFEEGTSPSGPADRHGHLPPQVRDAVLREAAAKSARTPGRAARLAALERGWEDVWRDLDAQLAGTSTLADDLRAAGAPARFSEIGVDRELAEALLVRAREMRDRYTVLDLAADLGRLPEWAAEIAEELA